jgi:O-antigen/teichoic acid export membrane protein
MVGPIGSAGAQFLLSLVLLRTLAPSDFGAFSFLLVASQFSWGIWSALFCAPLPILLQNRDEAATGSPADTMLSVSLTATLLAALIFGSLSLAMRMPVETSLIFAGYAAIALLRWFARAFAYAMGSQLRTTFSDVIYCALVLVGTGLLLLTHVHSLAGAYAVLLVAGGVGLLPFGHHYLARQFIHVRIRHLRGYIPVWKQHSGWSLLGVLTTEATANSHAYIVTLVLGPTAFAPIAASALMIRPIGVAMNALTEFERARIARQIGGGDIKGAFASIQFFRLVLLALWIGSALAAALLFSSDMKLLIPAQYDRGFIIAGGALWMAVAGMRMIRTPDSALLQAVGAFRPLAHASLLSSILSVAAVIVLLLAGGPLWSIAGIFLGEAMLAGWTWMQARQWRRTAVAPSPLPLPVCEEVLS